MAAPDNPNPEPQSGLRPDVPPLPPDQRTGYAPDPKFEDTKAKTARKLAYFLIGLLTLVSIMQYLTIHALVWQGKLDSVPVFEHLFNAVLPVVAGLASSAATYYFTRDK